MVRNTLLFLCVMFVGLSFSQNYLGGGNSTNITVTSSSTFQDPNWPQNSSDDNTVNDNGMLAPYFDAHRFLTQATIGFESSHVDDVLQMGIESWIDDQFTKPTSYLLPETESVFSYLENLYNEDWRRPGWNEFNYAWWQIVSTNEDLLRHKIACALSEILVISRNSELGGYGDGLAAYYDMLLDNAFGNYRDLLLDVALHPCMGYYLSHMDNPKTNGDIHPDENFAREIMQLKSIGLYLLNIDGSHMLINGDEQPTYSNTDIAELAKVFTGLGVGDVVAELVDPGDTAFFGMGIWEADMTIPMKMYEEDAPYTSWRDEDQHEDGPKNVLGTIIDIPNSGMAEINAAIDILFNHDNVGPFIGYRLIQRLVKSNPSPGYIQRVAEVFNDNGSGVRGDMKAVIKAILLDDEARQAAYQLDDENSKLKEPLFRYTQFSRMVDKYNPLGHYWNIGYSFYEEAKQAILASPSVFNFFKPDDRPNGDISNAGLVAPEFKLHDSRSSIGYINNAFYWTIPWGNIMGTWIDGNLLTEAEREVVWDQTALLPMLNDPETYVNWIDTNILGGMMTDHTRLVIRMVLNELPGNDDYRLGMAMQIALISPEYSILK